MSDHFYQLISTLSIESFKQIRLVFNMSFFSISIVLASIQHRSSKLVVTPINVTMITQSPLPDSMLLMPSKLCVFKLDNFTLLISNDYLVRYYLDEIVNIKSNNLKTGKE